MIKISNQMGRQFVSILAYVKDTGKAVSTYRDHLFGNWRRDRLELRTELTPAMRMAGAAAQDNWRRDDETSLDEMFNTIGAQLNGRDGDSSLIIDRVAEILTSPHAKQILAGRALEALKKAVLNPQELTGLDERLQAGEVHCTSCQKIFTSGEVVTMFHEPTPRGILKPQLYCTKCLAPSYIPCHSLGCNEAVPLSSKQLGFFAKKNTECEHLKLLKDRAQQAGDVVWAAAPDLRADPFGINEPRVVQTAPNPARPAYALNEEMLRGVGAGIPAPPPNPLQGARWDQAQMAYVMDDRR